MRSNLLPFLKSLLAACMMAGSLGVIPACASGGGGTQVLGNEGGSTPLSDAEGVEYQKAVTRCHKTGGTRIVKIKGELRCY